MGSAFSVLSRIIKEPALTETLRYLFDSNEAHGCNDSLFRQLAKHFSWPIPKGILNITAVSEWGTDQGREVDIVLIVRERWDEVPILVIGCEAKLWTGESNDQIKDYQEGLSKAFPKVPKRFIYLTPAGNLPGTADLRLSKTCPVSALKWSELASLLTSGVVKSSIAEDMATYISRHISNQMGAGLQGVKLFNDSVIPKATRALQIPEGTLRFAWGWPKSNPHEFNLRFEAANPTFLEDRVGFYYMYYAPSRNFAPGHQVHLLLMAYSDQFSKKDEMRVDAVRLSMPPREGRIYQWGPWKCLWSGGVRTLVDIGEKDGSALAALLARAHACTEQRLIKAISLEWGQS